MSNRRFGGRGLIAVNHRAISRAVSSALNEPVRKRLRTDMEGRYGSLLQSLISRRSNRNRRFGRYRKYSSSTTRYVRSRPEIKQHSRTHAPYTNNVRTIDNSSNYRLRVSRYINQGPSARDERIGIRIQPVSLHFKAELISETPPTAPVLCKILLVQTLRQRAGDDTPKSSDIYDGPSYDFPNNSHIFKNLATVHRDTNQHRNLRILKTWDFAVTSSSLDNALIIDDYMSTNLPRYIEYDEDGNPVANDLNFFVYWNRPKSEIDEDDGVVTAHLTFRFRYLDT